MVKVVPALAILSGGLLVAGCQTAGSNLRQLNNGIRPPESATSQLRAEQQLAAGRAALQQRNYAAAIAALREAAVDPALAPASLNGLGVAYSGIGRNDLAEQYFRRAISADPANPRYEENLARLYRAQLAADQARRDKLHERELAEAQRQQALRDRQLASGIRVAAPVQQMVAVNRGEVLIRTGAPETSAPAAAPKPAARLAVTTAVPGALIPARSAAQAAPVRLGAVQIGPAAVEATKVEPARIELAKAKPTGIEPTKAAPAKAIATQAAPVQLTVAASPAVLAAPRVAVISAPGLRPNAPVSVMAAPRAAIVIEGRRPAAAPQLAKQPAPAVLAVSTSGRVYGPPSDPDALNSVPTPGHQPAVRLAMGKELSSAIVKPRVARQLILGDLADNNLPLGSE